jgi:serine/threonine protein kinase
MDREKEMLHIFQEWVPGGSIASLLNKFGPFPLTVVRTYLYQAIQGLSYLHEHHILHRDIKGGNLLVNDEGIVKLADFGTSKRLQVSPDGSAVDMDAEDVMANMTMCGTPFFMAPEVFEEQYGSKADVWSCACVAHQMCTGSPPWKGLGIKGPVRLFSYIMEHEGPPPVIMEVDGDDDGEGGSMNKSLADLLEQCFQRKPSKRPSTQTLLQHHFFQESDSNECITEDGSVPGGSVLGSRSACSPISPQKLVHLKTVAAQEELTDTIHNKQEVVYDSHGWPAWAKSNFADTKLPQMQRN